MKTFLSTYKESWSELMQGIKDLKSDGFAALPAVAVALFFVFGFTFFVLASVGFTVVAFAVHWSALSIYLFTIPAITGLILYKKMFYSKQ
ncbi:hypothetical protein HUG15_19650 [Salicibibacter cibarius]|uniref:Uncharacterized protein n=1 Tax=Salicibibacter cibarius TaxID=2743000 RepID=A0A7T6Z5X7_9BACI|nr:hypothetical protein [Salicibibacter cibarius]QQK77578.1 hypothetical protein HUG15_19650 [Salicibibacter cibarius]